MLANVGTELGTAVEARQKLESQQQENSTVKKVRRREMAPKKLC
jgi:hypothetical protein